MVIPSRDVLIRHVEQQSQTKSPAAPAQPKLPTPPTAPMVNEAIKPKMPQDWRLEPEYLEPWLAYSKQPGPKTREAVVSALAPTLGQGLTAFGDAGSRNLKAQAKLMAAKALDTYEPQRGTLRTHVLSQLQGLRRKANREQQIIHVPERHANMLSQLRDKELELQTELGRAPSDGELSDATMLSLRMLEKLRRSAAPVNDGRFVDQTGERFTPASQVPGQRTGHAAWVDFVYEEQPPINQFIMDRTLGLHGHEKMQTQEIAKQLGITAGAVSQRTAKLQRLLDDPSGKLIHGGA